MRKARIVAVPGSLLSVAGFVAGVVAPGVAQEAGDVAAGRTIATTICVACHVVGRGEFVSPTGAAPAFTRLAATPGMTSIALSAALQTSHKQMPNIILQPDERRDVIAYILSLK
jgi:mono/diheme cytochrome c family protein